MNKSVDSPLLYAYNLGYLSRSSNPLPITFGFLSVTIFRLWLCQVLPYFGVCELPLVQYFFANSKKASQNLLNIISPHISGRLLLFAFSMLYLEKMFVNKFVIIYSKVIFIFSYNKFVNCLNPIISNN